MLEVLPFRLRHSDVARADTREIGLNTHELLRVWIRQRMQKRCGNYSEDRCRRPNSQSHRQNNDGSEAGRLSQHAHPEAEILPEFFKHRTSILLWGRDLI